jgi:CO/xanthine dehydrogenase FAD-binding subunit
MPLTNLNPHPDLPAFDYLQPGTPAEASRFLVQHPPPAARPFLGGTDLFIRLRDGAWQCRCVVDLKRLPGVQELAFDPQTGLTFGAAVDMNRLIASPAVQAHYPLLAQACASVASYQLRRRATVVGNLCNASPAADTAGACLVYGAELRVYGPSGERREPLAGFFLGPGRTRLQAGEIVLSLRLPPPPAGACGRYIKLGRNRLSDLAIVGVTALGYPDPTCPSGYRFRLALASVAPLPLVPAVAEACLAERPPAQATFMEAARLAQQACDPIDDLRASARYRRAMVHNLTLQALEQVAAQMVAVPTGTRELTNP